MVFLKHQASFVLVFASRTSHLLWWERKKTSKVPPSVYKELNNHLYRYNSTESSLLLAFIVLKPSQAVFPQKMMLHVVFAIRRIAGYPHTDLRDTLFSRQFYNVAYAKCILLQELVYQHSGSVSRKRYTYESVRTKHMVIKGA